MTALAELARLIRSKNAGPFELTFDIMFEDAETYGLPPERVKFFYCDNALAVKASIPRPVFQGDLADSDGHGGQQYAPLMGIDIP